MNVQWRPSLLVLFAVAVLCAVPGCSWVRNTFGVADEPTEVTEPVEDDDDRRMATPDSILADPPVDLVEPDETEVEAADVEPPERVPEEIEEAVERDVPSPADEPLVPQPVEATAPAPADSQLVDPDPPLRVHIDEDERDALLERIEADLAVARAASARQPDLDTLGDEQRQRWETLAHYVRRTVAFLEADDLRAAGDLALKARLLASELDPR